MKNASRASTFAALLVVLAATRLARAQPASPDGSSSADGALPPPAPAAAPAPKWADEIAVNAFVSVTWEGNANRPDSRTNQLRVFDFDANSFKLDVAELTIRRDAAGPREAGFRVDLEAGSSIPRVSSSYGLLQGEDVDVKQAFVSFVAPVGRGLRFDVGKFVTHFSYEYIESWDTPNDDATRSFLFGYAIPFTHTGLKASYPFSDRLSAMVMLCNGWDQAKDVNSAKSVGAQLLFTPTKALSIAVDGMWGPERPGVDSDPRTVLDVVAQWKLTDLVVLGLNPTWGSERGAVAPGLTATWSGVAGYARLGLSPTFALCARAEIFDDPDGARTGTPQRLEEVTLTPEWKLTPKLVLRADLRNDWSNHDVFEKRDGGTARRQPTLAINAFWAF